MRVLSQYFSLVSSTAELGIELRDGDNGREFVIRSVYGPGSRILVEAQARMAPIEASAIQDEVIKETQMLLPSPTKIEMVAARLALSSRVLQRRLTDAGLSFRDLAVQTRADIARGYLQVGGTVAEVALLVGYADATAFTRMYKKATGRLPNEDRISK